MNLEPEVCARIRELIATSEKDDAWYRDVCYHTGWIIKDLAGESRFPGTWDLKWGTVNVKKIKDRLEIHWFRPDGGPTVVVNTNVDLKTALVDVALKAALIRNLNKNNYLSFVKHGFPAEWNKSKVFFNGKEVHHIVWACAITNVIVAQSLGPKGKAEVKDKETMATQEITGGLVTIPIQEQQLSFF